jgi:hypothetical protein
MTSTSHCGSQAWFLKHLQISSRGNLTKHGQGPTIQLLNQLDKHQQEFFVTQHFPKQPQHDNQPTMWGQPDA